MMEHQIELMHRTETGHRIPGHQGGKGKCARLHGHTYMYVVTLTADLLERGFVVDFGDVKALLDEWDHRILLWENDPFIVGVGSLGQLVQAENEQTGIIRVPFVPTAEHMAMHLAKRMLAEFDNIVVADVVVRETPATSARYYAQKGD